MSINMLSALPQLKTNTFQPVDTTSKYKMRKANSTILPNSSSLLFSKLSEAEIIRIGESLIETGKSDKIQPNQAIQIIRYLKTRKQDFYDNPIKQMKIDQIIDRLATMARNALFSSTKGFDIERKKSQIDKLNVAISTIRNKRQSMFLIHQKEKYDAISKEMLLQVQRQTSFMLTYGQELPFEVRQLMQQAFQLRDNELRLRNADKNFDADIFAQKAYFIETNRIKASTSKFSNSAPVQSLLNMLRRQHRRIAHINSTYNQKWEELSQDSSQTEMELNHQLDTTLSELNQLINPVNCYQTSRSQSECQNINSSFTKYQTQPYTTRKCNVHFILPPYQI